jgi:hypothetical protein
MSKLTREFVEDALRAQHVWDLGNGVLYKLCADHPGHTDDDVIVAKTLLIGRVYAAALERRRDKGEVSGDAFYLKVARDLRCSDINLWWQDLNNGPESSRAIQVHKQLTDLLKEITGLEKRSFASKYLHFHFPGRFFIYDSRAEKSAKKLIKLDRRRKKIANADTSYADFCARCERLGECIGGLIERVPTPRELDKVLLHWSEKNSGGQGR